MAYNEVTLEAPYPLHDRFRKIILPSLLVLTLFIGFVMSSGSSWLTEKIYLEISEKRAATISRAMQKENYQAWDALQRTSLPKDVFATPDGRSLLNSLRNEVQELGLSHLKVYGKNGLVLYSSIENQIGQYDPSKGYQNAFRGIRTLVEKQLGDGSKLYELYVQVPNNPHAIVMELYEPVDYLDSIVMKTVVPATLIPVGVLLLLSWGMNSVVRRAQLDIDYRTSLLSEFRERLQKLVSKEAVETLRSSTCKGDVVSRRVQATILFSDVRGFTDFCEGETPEAVVTFLNQSLGIVIDAIHQQKGDVDKMIGDAVLAYFLGESAEQRALAAAQAAQDAIEKATLPRGIGIGISTGKVVIGTVGLASRMDFTVIGDTVNRASRLCSAAKEGEIIIDQESASQSGINVDENWEHIQVKGRIDPIFACRLRVAK